MSEHCEAYGYAVRLLHAINERNWPGQEIIPLPDLVGVLTQIDHLTAHLTTARGWGFDISQAPRGNTVDDFVQTAKGVRKTTRFLPVKVILATKCGKVTVSKYMPDDGRWEMLQKGEQPVAWQLWPIHPDFEEVFHSLPSTPGAAKPAGVSTPPSSPAGTNSDEASQ